MCSCYSKTKKTHIEAFLSTCCFMSLLLMTLFFASCHSREKTLAEAHELKERGERAFSKRENVYVAVESLQQAMKLYSKLGDEDGYFESAVYMALVLEGAGRSDSAYSLLKTLKYVETKNPDAFGSLYYYRIMAFDALNIDHDPQKALAFNEKCLALEKRLYPDKPAYQYIDLANRAEFYYHAGEYDKTEEIIAQFDTLPELTNQVYLSQVHYTKALLSMRNRDYDEAMRHAELGRQYGETFHAFQNQIACTELMMKVDLARNDLPSYVLHDGQNEHLDSLSRGTEVNYQIALIEGRGEAMLVEQEIKRKETIFFFLWVLTAMLFIGLFVFFYFHRKTAKARLHLAELQKQQLDEEVTRERLEKELAELKAMQNAQKLNKAQRENVAISLQLATSDGKNERNKQLQLLEEQIKSLDPHFYDKLETKYPNLTRGELRLIAFMKLRMSNQDVMEVMNITLSALQKSRYRLRKKLGVPERENLENFIAKL